MFNKTLLKKIHTCSINTYDQVTDISNKIEIFTQQTHSLMNKQELLLKAINEDRLVITKILEHLEKLETKKAK